MTGNDALSRITRIQIPARALQVVATVAELLSQRTGAPVDEVAALDKDLRPGMFQVEAPPQSSQPGGPHGPRMDGTTI